MCVCGQGGVGRGVRKKGDGKCMGGRLGKVGMQSGTPKMGEMGKHFATMFNISFKTKRSTKGSSH